jgi:hypothetical protein
MVNEILQGLESSIRSVPWTHHTYFAVPGLVRTYIDFNSFLHKKRLSILLAGDIVKRPESSALQLSLSFLLTQPVTIGEAKLDYCNGRTTYSDPYL